jgi:pyruvate/2-oxoglutarate dehydrogenase complex dihydrolipoamide dehydrogenase (E3) component/uncharacterized membrane protein YdjX (TVP38/TMEM64 family)
MNPSTILTSKKDSHRWLLAAVIVIVVVLFFVFDLQQFLTLEYLQASRESFTETYTKSPFTVLLIYFLIYVVSTALSIPGALVLTLAGGALFGVGWGVVLVSFASSLGATLAMMTSRFLLRDFVQQRLGSKLQSINEGIEKQGAFYLFTLRLVPVVPFFVVNLGMGLTPIGVWTFYWVSQVGMLAGTLIYVNAGTHLAQLESLSGIASPGLLISFVLLGIFPWLARFFVQKIELSKLLANWKKPNQFDRNLIVIGAGAAGLVSAYIAAATKAKVTLVEAHKMGGDCLNYGCVPSKALIRSAKLLHQMRNASCYGLQDSNPSFSFDQVMKRVHRVIADIEPHDSIERYTSLGVEVIHGYAKMIDPWTVEIQKPDGSSQSLSSAATIIAAGAAPFVPSLPGLEEVGYLTSDTLWEKLQERKQAPSLLVVLGGGAIGTELTQAFARMGSQVTQIEMAPRIMLREDPEVSEMVQKSLEQDGVTILTNHKAVGCGLTDSEKWIEVEHEGKVQRLAFDELIVAVGRAPRLKGFGLEELGIPVGRVVQTNEYLETIYPHILAAGDVAGPFQFTHTAGHQAWYAAVNALFGGFKKFRVDYRVIPWATFCDPEVARVGLNELEAQDKRIAYEVTRYGIDDLDRAIVDSSAKGMVKVLTVPGKDEILGVTLVGEHAGDLISEFVLAMKHGLGLNKILGTIHIYPTLAEANKYVAGEWRRAHVNPNLLSWLERFHAWRRG